MKIYAFKLICLSTLIALCNSVRAADEQISSIKFCLKSPSGKPFYVVPERHSGMVAQVLSAEDLNFFNRENVEIFAEPNTESKISRDEFSELKRKYAPINLTVEKTRSGFARMGVPKNIADTVIARDRDDPLKFAFLLLQFAEIFGSALNDSTLNTPAGLGLEKIISNAAPKAYVRGSELVYDFSKADHEKIYILASRLASELSEELGCQRCSRQLNAANTRLSAAIVKNDASALQSAISQSETSFNSTQRLKEMTAFRDQHIARHILIRVSEVDKASIPIFIIGAAHFTKKTGIVDQLIFRGAYACEGG